MLANLGMDFASIMSKEYADKLEAGGKMADFSTKPIGTGPFKFVDYQLDAVIRYAAHPDYSRARRRSTIWSSPSPPIRPRASRR